MPSGGRDSGRAGCGGPGGGPALHGVRGIARGGPVAGTAVIRLVDRAS